MLALSFVSTGCRSAEEKYAAHLERGAAFEKDGKRDEALIEYRNALQIQPSSAEANFRIARVLSAKDKHADALFFYRETQRLDPTRSDAAMAEAKLLIFQDTARAEEIVKETLAREPSNALAYLRTAEIALARGDTKTALASVMTAIELDPKDGQYPLNLGTVAQARIRELAIAGKEIPDSLFEAALQGFRKADEIYGGNVIARLGIARTYARWPGHEKDTEAALRDAVAFTKEKGTPEDQRMAAQGVLDFAALTRNRELRAWGLERLVEAEPGAIFAWAEMAANADAAGQSGDAVYQRLLAARPADVSAYAGYAVYLIGKNRADEGLKLLEDAAAKGVEPSVALDEKTRFLIQLKRIEEATAVVARLKKDHPAEARTALAAARLALYEKRPADAVAELRHAAGSNESPEAQFLLSLAEFSLGNLEAATAAIDRSLALTPQFSAPLLQQKVAIRAAARDWPAVLEGLNRIETGLGTLPPELRGLLAQALYGTKNAEGGRQVLERMMNDLTTLPVAAVLFAEHEGANDPQAAYKYLEGADRTAPGQPPITAALVRLDLATRKPDRALERLDAALAGGNEIPALRLLRAQVLATKGDLEAAESDARRVLESGAKLPGTIKLLVAIGSARGNSDAAMKSLEALEKAGNLHGEERSLLARLYLAHGDEAAARAQFEKVVAENPELAEAKNDLAFLLAVQRLDLDRALQLAQDAQRGLPDVPDAIDTLGFVYLQKGLHEPAIDRFRYAIDLAKPGAPAQPVLWYHLGLAYAASGRPQEAAEAFEKALATGVPFPEAEATRNELKRVRPTKTSAAAATP